MRMLVPGNEVYTIFWFMFLEIPFYFLLAFYLEKVFPTEYGVRKPWHFPVTDFVQAYNRHKQNKIADGRVSQSEYEMAMKIQIDESETKFEDQDVKDERNRVLSEAFNPENYPLVMKNMRKVYNGRGGVGPKLAVKDVTFAVEKGVTFGLLGPNGA